MPSIALCGGGLNNIFMYYVYILKLSNDDYYVGYSNDLKQRITVHDQGKCSATANYGPIKLVWYCCFKDKQKALDFETYLKKGTGHSFRKRHLI